jgi:hypothetical protein
MRSINCLQFRISGKAVSPDMDMNVNSSCDAPLRESLRTLMGQSDNPEWQMSCLLDSFKST